MVKLTDLSRVKIMPIQSARGYLVELVFECGQRFKVSPESLISFAERAIRQAEVAKDYQPSTYQPVQELDQ